LVGADAVSALIDHAKAAGCGDFDVAPYEAISRGLFIGKFDVAVCNFSLLGKESVETLFSAIVYAQAIKGLLTLEPGPDKQAKYIDFVDIYSALDDNEMQIYTEKYPQEAKAMSTLSERLREEGMQQGVLQGMQQGEVILLKRLLSRRFGVLDAVTVQRLESASTDDLEQYAENLLDANSLEDVFTRH